MRGESGRTVRCARRRGGVIVAVAVAMTALLSMVALSVDYGVVAIARQQLQDAVDTAALAAAGQLGDAGGDASARAVAVQVALCNQCLRRPVTIDSTLDITVGSWDPLAKRVVTPVPTRGSIAVQVTARRTAASPDGPVPLGFSRIFGLASVNVTATAAAGVVVDSTRDGSRKPLEMIVVQDASSSFADEWRQAIDADWGLYSLMNGRALEDDRIGYVAFNEGLKKTSYKVYYKDAYGYWRYDYMPTYKRLSALNLEGEALPQAWQDHHTLVRNDSPSGYTNPAIALDWAIDEFVAHGNASLCQQSIVLVSDGMPYGTSDYYTQKYRNDAVTQADRAASLGMRVHTITLTQEAYGEYGWAGADFEFNQSLVRNGGFALRTHDASKLCDLMEDVGTLDVGKPRLLL